MSYHVGQGAAQAVQAWDYHDIAGLEAREQIMQLGLLVAMLRAGPLFHDLLASRLGQRAALRSGRTFVSGTVPKVADQHGAVPPDEPWFTREPPRRSAEREGVPLPSNSGSTAAPRSTTMMISAPASLHIYTFQNLNKVSNWGKTPGKDEPHSNLYH